MKGSAKPNARPAAVARPPVLPAGRLKAKPDLLPRRSFHRYLPSQTRGPAGERRRFSEFTQHQAVSRKPSESTIGIVHRSNDAADEVYEAPANGGLEECLRRPAKRQARERRSLHGWRISHGDHLHGQRRLSRMIFPAAFIRAGACRRARPPAVAERSRAACRD